MTKGAVPLLEGPTRYAIYHYRAPEYRTRKRVILPRNQDGRASRPHLIFHVILSGALEMQWREQGEWRELKAGPGDVVCGYPANDFYEANSEDPRYTAYTLHVEWRPPGAGLPLLTHDQRGLVRLLAVEMLAIHLDDLPAPLKSLVLKQYFLALVAELLRLNAPGPPPMEERLRYFVEEHRKEHFGVTELARHFGLRKRRFQIVYKAATGRTPMADVRRAKANFTRMNILTMPHLPLKEIARRAGLKSAGELNRLLKRHFGVSARGLAGAVRRVRSRSPETPLEKRVNSA